jgi:hypothetical protein
MKCTWCDKEAEVAGKAPLGTAGVQRLAACDLHTYLIELLKYTPIDVGVLSDEQRREARQKAKQ